VNDLEIKAFENEKKVNDIEFTMQQHILQYQLALKQQKRKEKNSRLALNNNNNNAPAATVVIGKLFPHYRYLGSVPIDFDKQELGKCLVDALCSIKLKDLFKKDYQQIGIVFNTDISTGPGQHWIALFCDIRPELEHPRITYFDSYANKPEPEIQRLMRRWKQEWDATQIHSKPMKMTYNNTRHQYEDSECGMYSLYFHYCCLNEVSMDKRIPDDAMNAFRNVLFKTN
jgi:hypothetical protein